MYNGGFTATTIMYDDNFRYHVSKYQNTTVQAINANLS